MKDEGEEAGERGEGRIQDENDEQRRMEKKKEGEEREGEKQQRQHQQMTRRYDK